MFLIKAVHFHLFRIPPWNQRQGWPINWTQRRWYQSLSLRFVCRAETKLSKGLFPDYFLLSERKVDLVTAIIGHRWYGLRIMWQCVKWCYKQWSTLELKEYNHFVEPRIDAHTLCPRFNGAQTSEPYFFFVDHYMCKIFIAQFRSVYLNRC